LTAAHWQEPVGVYKQGLTLSILRRNHFCNLNRSVGKEQNYCSASGVPYRYYYSKGSGFLHPPKAGGFRRKNMMKIASVADIKAKFSGYLKASEQGPVVVTKNGKPVALLISITDEDEIERMVLGHSPKFRRIVEVAEQQIREGKGIKGEDFWQEVESDTIKTA
jgi:prevent-host-death family protein